MNLVSLVEDRCSGAGYLCYRGLRAARTPGEDILSLMFEVEGVGD